MRARLPFTPYDVLRGLPLALIALALAACQAPPAAAPDGDADAGEAPPAAHVERDGAEGEGDGPPVVVRVSDERSPGSLLLQVGEDRIHARDVVDLLIARKRTMFDDLIKDLTIKRIVEREAARLQLSVSDELIDADYARDLDKANKHAQLNYRMSFEALLKRQGRTLAEFERASRERSRHLRRLHRIVRYAHLRVGAIKIRHIVVKERAEADAIHAKLAAGANFEAMARQHSHCPSKRRGGRLSMIVPGLYEDPEHPKLEPTLWKLSPGQLSPVLQARTGFHIFEALGRWEPAKAGYADRAEEVEKSLPRFPVTDLEMEWWLEQIQRRYPIKQHF